MQMVTSRSSVLRRAATTLLLIIALIVLVSPRAWSLDGRAKDGISAEAASCPIGVYVTSLRGLDSVGDSFGIDFWVWSVHPQGDDPLKSLEFVNSKQIETRLERTSKRGDREWSRLKARATVLHNWNLTDFPFDRQKLMLDLGIVGSDASARDAATLYRCACSAHPSWSSTRSWSCWPRVDGTLCGPRELIPSASAVFDRRTELTARGS